MKHLIFHGALGVCLVTSCGDPHDMEHGAGHDMGDASSPLPPASSGGPFSEPRSAEDTNPDPRIVEISLEARMGEVEYVKGKRTAVWTYNGTVPGPTLDAKVGDTLIVHFRNSLSEATSIHWHGLRVPNAMDGMTHVPAGGTFDYQFRLLDAGTFWYHPHVRTDDQVRRGLYGAVVVHGEDEPALGVERVAFLNDALLDANGSFASGGAMTGMNGLEGNVLLVNGVQLPAAELSPGARQRWRFINAANARYFKLAIPGEKLVVVGGDQGLLAQPKIVDSLLLVPGERAEILVSGSESPGDVELVSAPYDRGQHMVSPSPQVPLLTLRTVPGDKTMPAPVPQTLRTIVPLPTPSATRTFRLSEDDDMAMNGDAVFRINGEAFPNVPPVSTKLSAVETWVVVNESAMDHPFHLHGFAFQVLDAASGLAEWKDTVNIPGKKEVRLQVSFEGYAGTWIYHCHILEHAERGMIGGVVVAD